ncbi:MAG: hypothetical protein AAF705_15635 [Bacteroidota bacterium]
MVIRYTLIFSEGETYLLFGEDFFNDKKVFWEIHQTKVKQCFEMIQQKGWPIKVYDDLTKEEQSFSNEREFKDWFLLHQQTAS